MTGTSLTYPDVEAVLIFAGGVEFPTGHVFVAETDDTLTDIVKAGNAVHAITRIGGADDTLTLDRATVHIDTFGIDRPSARDAAEALRSWLRFRLTGTWWQTFGAAVGLVATSSAPAWLPYANPNVRRIGHSYVIVVHARTPIPLNS